MGNLSVGNLTNDSEKIMQEDINSELAWGPLYVGQLDDVIDTILKVPKQECKTKYLEEGFTDYIAKPFTRDQIKEKLDKIL